MSYGAPVSTGLPFPAQLAELFRDGAGNRAMSVPLPPGRIIRTEEGRGRPGLWMTEGSAPEGSWAKTHAENRRSGLWPLLLGSLRYDTKQFRPWDSGELSVERIASPDLHDSATLLAGWWSQYTEFDAATDSLSEPERSAVTAPYGRQWPGLAPAKTFTADPDALAYEYATHLISNDPSMRLGLVAANRGADSLAVAGWTGPTNYTNDTGEVSAVVRNWEDRYGVRVVGAGFADLYLSVAAPPATLDEALHVAAEHFALCPDNIWQGQHPQTLAAYAERLIGLNSWEFWWD
jgi:hypothetical protein